MGVDILTILAPWSSKKQDNINAAVNDLDSRALNEGEREPQEPLHGVGKEMRQANF